MTPPFLPEAREWLRGCSLPPHVAVGFSGGADSTALLLALRSLGHRPVAWHVNHGWRPDAEAEEKFLRRRLEAWNITFHSARVESPSSNREARARDARYRQFLRWAGEQNARVLCLAHHRDDQAETVCMRMLQGAGVSGCAGMRMERKWNGILLMRPLLSVSAAALRRVLRRAGVEWLEDSSNRDPSLWRNRIRHRLFPTMRRYGVEPVDLFLRWQRQAERLAMELERRSGCVSVSVEAGKSSVRWRDWSALSPPLRALVLQRMMAAVFGEGTVLGRRHIELAEAWRRRGGRGGIDLCRSRLVHVGENLHLQPQEVRLRRKKECAGRFPAS